MSDGAGAADDVAALPSEPEVPAAPLALGLPVPPPSERHGLLVMEGPASVAVRLLAAHGAVAQALCARSPADFRPLPALASSRREVLTSAFSASGQPRVLPSVALTLAPLVAPRLERVVTALRRRLARERALLPLHAVTEMDPTCLRRNARLPGRTLVEKAGPKQRLVGVRRVARFDTMENRVLLRAATMLGESTRESLAHLPAGLDRTDPNRRSLRRLQAACEAVVARPELEGIGDPRPGERPSNALVGDADYRAAWRAWQLLRREEDRFVDEWLGIDAVWCELLVMALWARLDATPGLEPMAGAVIVEDVRAQWRIAGGGARRWVAWRPEGPVIVEVLLPERRGGVIEVRVGGERLRLEAGLALVLDALVDETTGEAPTAELAARRAAELVAAFEWSDPIQWAARVAAPGQAGAQASVASALDATLRLGDGLSTWESGPSAAGRLEVERRTPDAPEEATAEAPLFVGGREATWLPDVAGPHALHRGQADLLGDLLEPLLLAGERAVIVPDSLDELASNALHRRMGRVWLVWAPVAAALMIDDPPPTGGTVAVVVLSDAALDVAMLERSEDAAGPFWIRSAPLRGDLAGREGERFPSQDRARGGWLRRPSLPDGWAIQGHELQAVDTRPSGSFASTIVERLGLWRGAPPDRLVAIGLSAEDQHDLVARLPSLRVEILPADVLVRGGQRFLDLHGRGVPTWKDRLPALGIRVRVKGDRKLVAVVPAGKLVAPGEHVRFASVETFQLGPREPRIRLDLWHEDAPAAYAFVLEGHPLPLAEPCEVRIEGGWTYGLSGMAGSLVPVVRSRFVSIPFTVAAPGDVGDAPPGHTPPPALPSFVRPPPMEPATVQRIAHALKAVEKGWADFPAAEQRRATKQAGVWDAPLGPLIKNLRDALERVSQPDAAARTVLATVAASMDWLLTGTGRKGAGPPPALGKDARDQVIRCRALTGERGDGGFVRWLETSGIRSSDRIAAVGRVIDGRSDAPWRWLREQQVSTPTDVEEWARAVCRALVASPLLAQQLDESDARRLLLAAVGRIEDLVAVEPRRSRAAVYRLALIPPWVCEVRLHGRLAPGDAEVVALAGRLRAVAEALPDEVRTWGGRESIVVRDPPVLVAADWLLGRYETLPSQVDT